MGDWLRNVFYGCFVLVFVGVMYSSVQRIASGKTAVSQVQKSARTLQYPSVTICPAHNNASMTGLCTAGQRLDSLDARLEDFLYGFMHSYQEENE